MNGGSIYLLNHQRTRPINRRILRWIIRDMLTDLALLNDFDLTVHLISAKRMTELNETVLHHEGSTDVITFDYSVGEPEPLLAGELFVCVDEAIEQAKRFKTTWQSELVRYIVHGVLHLQGFDDLAPVARRKMKREENRRLKELAVRFHLSKVGGKSRVNP